MAYIRCGGGGIPATLKTDMNSVLNKKFGTISQDYPPNEWADDVNLLGKLPERTASGTIAHFNDGADLVPLKSCEVTVTPSQSGTGDPSPTNPRPLNSFSSLTVEHTGANMLDGARAKDYAIDTFSTSTSGTNDTGDYYTLQVGNVINNQNLFPWLKFNANTQYTLILKIGKNNTATSTNIRVVYTDGTGDNLTRTGTSDDPETAEILVFTTNASKSVKEIVGYYQSGKTYLYYGNIGIFSGVVTAQDFATFTGDPHTLALGSTVYGLTGDCVSGEFEETHGVVDLGLLTWTTSGSGTSARWYCSDLVGLIENPTSSTEILDMKMEKYKPINYGVSLASYPDYISVLSDGRLIAYNYDGNSPSGLCAYPLATPTALTIDPVEIESFKGVNNVWCTQDNSTVAVEYRADIDLLITELGG